MNKDIAVLLCTYNGEKYLCTQLDSILKQKDVNVTLFVRDDGSSDETCNILNRYKTQYPDKVILVENVNKNLGPGLGFMKLFFKVFKEYKRFSFYAFADQDDIWLDNKLYEGIKKIGDVLSPVLYCSDLWIYQNNRICGLKYGKTKNISLQEQLIRNELNGCTFIMNNDLASTLYNAGMPNRYLLNIRNHDAWIVLVAILVGKTVLDNNAYIHYRIHTNNTVGLRTKFSLMKRKEKFGKLFPYHNIWRINAEELNKRIKAKSKDKALLNMFMGYTKNLKSRIRFYNFIKEYSSDCRPVLFIKILLGYP